MKVKVGVRKFTKKNEEVNTKKTKKKIRKLIAKVVKPEKVEELKSKKRTVDNDYRYNMHLINPRFWTETEDSKILDGVRSFLTRDEISNKLNRTEYAIEYRMRKLKNCGAFDNKLYYDGLMRRKKKEFFKANPMSFTVVRELMLDPNIENSEIIVGMLMHPYLNTGDQSVMDFITDVHNLGDDSDLYKTIYESVDMDVADGIIGSIKTAVRDAKIISIKQVFNNYKKLTELYGIYKYMIGKKCTIKRISEKCVGTLFTEYNEIVSYESMRAKIIRMFNNGKTVYDIYKPSFDNFGSNVGDNVIIKAICNHIFTNNSYDSKAISDILKSMDTKYSVIFSIRNVEKMVTSILSGVCNDQIIQYGINKEFGFKSVDDMILQIKLISNKRPKFIRWSKTPNKEDPNLFNPDEKRVIITLYKLLIKNKHNKVNERKKILNLMDFTGVYRKHLWYYHLALSVIDGNIRETSGVRAGVIEIAKKMIENNLDLVNDEYINELFNKVKSTKTDRHRLGRRTSEYLLFILDCLLIYGYRYPKIADMCNEKFGILEEDSDKLAVLLNSFYNKEKRWAKLITDDVLKKYEVSSYDELIDKVRYAAKYNKFTKE